MHKVAPRSELSLANSKCIFRLFWNASSITESAAKAALRHDLWLAEQIGQMMSGMVSFRMSYVLQSRNQCYERYQDASLSPYQVVR